MKKIIMLIGFFFLIACGGGGGASSSNSAPSRANNSNDNVTVKYDPSNKTFEQIYDDFTDMRLAFYGGITTQAKLSNNNLRQFSQLVLRQLNTDIGFPDSIESSSNASALKLVSYTTSRISQFSQNNQTANEQVQVASQEQAISIDEQDSCDSGTVRVLGELDDNSTGPITVIFQQCELDNVVFDGEALTYFYYGVVENVFLNQLAVTDGGEKYQLTGDSSTYGLQNMAVYDPVLDTTFQVENWSEFFSDTSPSVEASITGYLYHADFGWVYVNRKANEKIVIADNGDIRGAIILTDSTKEFEGSFVNKRFNYVIKQSSNGEPINSVVFNSDDTLELTFVDYNYPPTAYFAINTAGSYYTSSSLSTVLDNLYDRENDHISVTYEWYINGIKQDISEPTLPPFIARKDDNVYARVILDDGINLVGYDSSVVYINDSPGTIFLDVPKSPLLTNQNYQLKFVLDDDDVEDTINNQYLDVQSVPNNSQFDGEVLVWQTPLEQSFPYLYYPVSFKTDEWSQLNKTYLPLVDSTKTFTAYKGVGLAWYDENILTGQFDNDANTEMLVYSFGDLYALKMDGETASLKWFYPYSAPSGKLLKADLNNDETDEVYILTGTELFQIGDFKAPPKKILSAEKLNINESFEHIAITDLNADGQLDLALLTATNLNIIETEQFTLIKSVDVPAIQSWNRTLMLVANVDDDLAQEVILSDGYVYDGVSLKNEWFYPDGFGFDMVLVDEPNNGMSRLASLSYDDVDYVTKLTLFDISAKKIAQEIEFNPSEFCRLDSGELDNKVGNELILHNCNNYSFDAYNLSSEGLNLFWQQSIGNTYNGSAFVFDIDNDNYNEVVIDRSTDEAYVVNTPAELAVNSAQAEVQTYKSERYYQTFDLLGEAKVGSNEKKDIIIAKDNDDQMHLVTLSEDLEPNILLSLPKPENFSTVSLLKLVDYNLDGIDELFVSYDDRTFTLFNLTDLSPFVTGTLSYYTWGKTVHFADLNQDGYQDILYVSNNTMVSHDIHNQQILNLSTQENNIEPLYMNSADDTAVKLFAHDYSVIKLWNIDEAGANLIKSESGSCDKLLDITLMSAEHHLVCLSNYEFTTYTSDLDKIATYDLHINGYVDAITYDASIAPDSILIWHSIYGEDGKAISAFSLNEGKITWKLPAISNSFAESFSHETLKTVDGELLINSSGKLYRVSEN
ncbi:VCBS repeat-containing protein [Catenovulum sp. SM1970]|uniref:FG-GAP repeat domain-containing protein n=1 Tax=Marinifaba aquimaris TaxID=2741323 RepID=UPI001572A03A|nr:VCBS repeat-containing protein [Marinifaba aquimaris]NTS77994.1 VCBS repeat-containing protein [Marinifaba aquimaris]